MKRLSPAGWVKVWNNRAFYRGYVSRPNLGASKEFPKLTLEAAMEEFIGRSGSMIYGKIGTTELQALEFADRWLRPAWPASLSWRRQARRLFIDSGVFPADRDQFDAFIRIYRESLRNLDGVCLWQNNPFWRAYEEKVVRRRCPQASAIPLECLSPFAVLGAISKARWLVVSPFTQTMERQVPHLPKILRDFSWSGELAEVHRTCQFLRCPLFSYLEKSPFGSWSEGLEKLGNEIQRMKFDVALVGAGAWSIPLLAIVRKMGRKGIHLGGATQIAFGIKGRRWDQYWGKHYNEFWTRPASEETPAGCEQKEGGCYW